MKSLTKTVTGAFSVAALCASLSVNAAPGDVDSTFGTGGAVYTSVFGTVAQTFAMARDHVGRFVIAGNSTDPELGPTVLMLARYLPDGTLDTTFGDIGSGIVLTAPPGGATGYAEYRSIAFDSKDRIICGGEVGVERPLGLSRVFTIARYSSDGILDRSFNGNGMVVSVVEASEMTSVASSVAVDANDRIVAAGFTLTPAEGDGVVLRYREDGSLDRDFARTGRVTKSVYGNYTANAVSIDSLGRIVVAGTDTDPSTSMATTFVGRYLDDGEADGSFGTDGYAENDDLQGSAMTLDATDGVVLSGFGNEEGTFVLTRFDSTGSIDTAFGSDGTGVVDTGRIAYSPLQVGLVLDGTGHILAGANLDEGMGAMRFNADGSPDASFGIDGVAFGPMLDGGSMIVGTSLIVGDPDHFIMGGWTADSMTVDLAVVRFEN